MFLGPFQDGGDFRDEGIVGIRRFLEKVWALVHERGTKSSALAEQKLHRTIRKVTADTEALQYNTAIAAMMEYVNEMRERGAGSRELLKPLVIMLAPYAPHVAEELWAVLGETESVPRLAGPHSMSSSPAPVTWRSPFKSTASFAHGSSCRAA